MTPSHVLLEGRGAAFLEEVERWAESHADLVFSCEALGPYVRIAVAEDRLGKLRELFEADRARTGNSADGCPPHMVLAIFPRSKDHPMGEWVGGPGAEEEALAVAASPGRHTKLSSHPSDLMRVERARRARSGGIA